MVKPSYGTNPGSNPGLPTILFYFEIYINKTKMLNYYDFITEDFNKDVDNVLEDASLNLNEGIMDLLTSKIKSARSKISKTKDPVKKTKFQKLISGWTIKLTTINMKMAIKNLAVEKDSDKKKVLKAKIKQYKNLITKLTKENR